MFLSTNLHNTIHIYQCSTFTVRVHSDLFRWRPPPPSSRKKIPRTKNNAIFRLSILFCRGHAVAQLVETLRYMPEGRGFDSRWCNWIFSLT